MAKPCNAKAIADNVKTLVDNIKTKPYKAEAFTEFMKAKADIF